MMLATERVIALGALFLALGLYLLSASAEPAEAYLFPRMISLGMLFIAIVLFIRSNSTSGTKNTMQRIGLKTILPGIIIFLTYLYALDKLGFYASAFIAFFTLITLYAPEKRSVRGWITRILVSLLVVGCMYLLFGYLLKVQAPTGLLF